MKVFNLNELQSHSYEERDKNVFYSTDEFKTRVIELSIGGQIPPCTMASYVMYIVINGSVEVQVNEDNVKLLENQCLITEPAILSMRTNTGVKMIGIQIAKN